MSDMDSIGALSRAIGNLEGQMSSALINQNDIKIALDNLNKNFNTNAMALATEIYGLKNRVEDTELIMREMKPQIEYLNQVRWFGKGMIFSASIAAAAIGSIITAAWQYFLK